VIIWLDPVSIDLQSPQGVNLSYNLSNNALSNGLGSSFVSVGGNVETIVLENAAGTYNLDVANVPSMARGGVVMLSANGFSTEEFTTELQGGVTAFQLNLGGVTNGPTSPTPEATPPEVSPSGPSGPAAPAAPGGALVSIGSAVLSSSQIAGPATTGGATSASSSSGVSAATAAAAAPSTGGATAVTQPLPSRLSPQLTGESAGEQSSQEESANGLPSVQTVLQAVKQVVSRAGGVMGALGRRLHRAVLRQLQGMLEKLSAPATANQSRGSDGARHAKPASGPIAPSALLGPLLAPTEGARPVDIVLWDRGLDGLLQDSTTPVPLDAGCDPRGLGALSAAVFLASGLVRSELREGPSAQPLRTLAHVGRNPRREPADPAA
jgi:hypothetical protein